MKYKIWLMVFVFVVELWGMPAIQKARSVKQPNGDVIVLHVKGDSAFHWLESGGDVVVYNPKDGYYYKARVDAKEGIVPTDERVKPSLERVRKSLDAEQIKSLKILQKRAKMMHNHPR